MTRTPDEVKQGLEYLSITNVAEKLERFKQGLPYMYAEEVAADSLALIQQLQDDNAEKHKRIQELERSLSFARCLSDALKAATVKQEQELYVSVERSRQLEAQNAELSGKIGQLQAERDALIEELKNAYSCFACKKFYRNGGECKAGGICMMRDFEWRGVQKEE